MQKQPTNAKPTNTAPQRDARGHFIKRIPAAVAPQLQSSRPHASTAPAPAAPRALDPTPPVLALFRHGEIAVLRIHDLSFSGVVSAVVNSLPGDVTSLMLVTPTDTKMFAVNTGGGTQHDTRQTHSRVPAEPEPELVEGAEEDTDPQADAIRAAAEGDRDAAAAGLEEASAQIDLADTPAARRKAMNERRRLEEGSASDPCGRCGGSGTMQVALPDGGASQAACPVCRGSGVIRRFGARR